MASRIHSLNNAQEMQVVVSGPDDANRLILCSGEAPAFTQANNNSETITWTFLVGPVLERRQFIRAAVSAGIAKMALNTSQSSAAAAPSTRTTWNIVSVDADWDDESGQVEVQVETRVELQVSPEMFVTASINGISYQVNILAALP